MRDSAFLQVIKLRLLQSIDVKVYSITRNDLRYNDPVILKLIIIEAGCGSRQCQKFNFITSTQPPQNQVRIRENIKYV